MKAWAHESMGFNPSPVADKDILSALATWGPKNDNPSLNSSLEQEAIVKSAEQSWQGSLRFYSEAKPDTFPHYNYLCLKCNIKA